MHEKKRLETSRWSTRRSSTRRCIEAEPRRVGGRRRVYLAFPIDRRAPMNRVMKALAIVASGLALHGCGYNTIQTQDEAVTAAWSEVVNQYQRRADLIPNLVETVRGYAAQERDVLQGVTNARARVGSIQATPELIE